MWQAYQWLQWYSLTELIRKYQVADASFRSRILSEPNKAFLIIIIDVELQILCWIDVSFCVLCWTPLVRQALQRNNRSLWYGTPFVNIFNGKALIFFMYNMWYVKFIQVDPNIYVPCQNPSTIWTILHLLLHLFYTYSYFTQFYDLIIICHNYVDLYDHKLLLHQITYSISHII